MQTLQGVWGAGTTFYPWDDMFPAAAARIFQQIVAGYYDSGGGAKSAADEIAAATGIKGLVGLIHVVGRRLLAAQALRRRGQGGVAGVPEERVP